MTAKRNSHYFENKEERAAHATMICKDNRRRFADAIWYSISHRDRCRITEDDIKESYTIRCNKHLYVAGVDSVSALFNMNNILCKGEDRKTPCILNFASYHNPGGMFLKGSSAQEESLCHESTLYNVLSSEQIVEEYYKPHKDTTNDHLYQSDSLITPNIVFWRECSGNLVIEYADVLTCAAPNAHAAKKYKGVSDDRITNALIERIYTVLYHAMINANDVLILGAYGCGVFGNDPFDVAYIFRTLLNTVFSVYFSAVIFAIPKDGKSEVNYRVFKDVITSDEYDGELQQLEEMRRKYKEGHK